MNKIDYIVNNIKLFIFVKGNLIKIYVYTIEPSNDIIAIIISK